MMFKQLFNLKNLLKQQSLLGAQAKGQGLVEYSLILVLVSVVSVATLSLLGQEVSGVMEETVCSLDDGEDCECRVIEKVVESEYSCAAGDLFAYTAITTCDSNTELSLLVSSSSADDEYAMSYNSSTNLFEMTDSVSICNQLSSAPSPDLYLVSRHTEDDSIHTFRLGANGVPQSNFGGGSSGSGSGDSSGSGSGSGSGDSSGSGSGSGSGDSSGSGSGSGSGDSSGSGSGSGSGDSSGSGSGSGSGDSSGSGSGSGSGDSSGSGSGSGSGDSSGSGSGSGSGDSSGSGSGSGSGDSNNDPVLSTVSTQTMDEDSSKTVTFSATDADGDTLTYAASGSLPAFMSFDGSATPPKLTIEPDLTDSGTYTVTIQVSDGNGGTDSVTFDVVVNDLNQAPELAAIGDQTVNESETKTITLSATDPDGDTLTYGLAGTLPGFITVDSSSGDTVITISPGYDDAGTHSITAYVTDTASNSDSETFDIVVQDSNRDPFITSVAAQSVNEGETATINISASDADGDTITLTATGTQGFMTFTPSGSNATLELAPGSDDSGSYSVEVSASDGTSSYSTTINITVVDVAVVNRVSFVVSNANSLGSGDSAVKSRLESNGYQVDTFSASTNESTVIANSPVLIIISESVSSGDVGSRFRNTAVPVMVMERALFDDMKMANNTGSDGGEKKIKIRDSSHPMAAGLSTGNQTVLSSSQTIGYGNPSNNNVIFIATIDNNTNRGTIFIYDTNTTMENGVKAPARRVGFFPYSNVPAAFNSNGWKLFDAAVDWATG